METNDNIDIAALAHQSNLWLNHKQIRDGRIDPRRFLNPNQPAQYPPQFQPQPPPYYPPNPYQQPYYPPQNFNNGGVNEYGLPESIPANNTQLPLIMRDKDGNPIDLMQAPSVAGQIQPQQYPSPINHGMQNVQGFQMPDYSKYNTVQPEKGSPPESTLDIILREIKSLKKAVNKLIRVSEQSKLPLVKSTNPILATNEVNDQSSIIPERICSSDSGD